MEQVLIQIVQYISFLIQRRQFVQGIKKLDRETEKLLQEFKVSHGQQSEFLFKTFGEVRRAAESGIKRDL